MKTYSIQAAAFLALSVFLVMPGHAALVTVDPDAFPVGTSLTYAFPGLVITDGSGASTINSAVGLTGTAQFARPGGVGDFTYLPIPPAATLSQTLSSSSNSNFILRFDFAQATDFVSLDLIPNDGNDPGSIAAFDAAGNLVGTASFGGQNLTGVRNTLTVSGVGIRTVLAAGDNVGNNLEIDTLRYNAGADPVPGQLDPDFSGDGIQTSPIGSGDDIGRSIVVQNDGKFVVAGSSFNGTDTDFALTRYNPDGTLDTTFSGDGKVTTHIGSYADDAYAVALQTDGKIVVVGNAGSAADVDMAVARFLPDGTLDTTFDGDGRKMIHIDSHDRAFAVAIQTDGKILLAGSYTPGGIQRDVAVVRLLANGSMDTSFDGDGVAITPIYPGERDEAVGMEMQADGKILVAAYASNGSSYDFAAIRYNTNGSLDTTFDTDGKVTTSFSSGNDVATGIKLQGDGKILVEGYSPGPGDLDFALVRYNKNGTLDTSFDGDGKLITDIGAEDNGAAVAVQADGKILIVGQANNGINFDFAVVRYLPDGTLDSSFGGSGKVTTAIGAGDDRALGVAIQDDGNIVAAGFSHNGSNLDFALVRYLGGPNDLLVNGGFESAETLGGAVPVVFGDWGFDQAAIVTAENGITPYEGSRMAKPIGTTIGGAAATTASEVLQYVNLSAYATEISAGTAQVTVSMRANRVAGNASTDTRFGILLRAWSGIIDSGSLLGSREVTLDTDGNPATWELLANQWMLPTGTTFLSVDVYAEENVVNDTVAPEYSGHYLDDVQLSMRTDFVTQAPILTSPATNAFTTSPVNVAFTLPENAQPGSVKLAFGATELTLAASQESAGAHSFSFNLANPSASPEIASGSTVADGNYTVMLSYQDALGNPVASATSVNVTVDVTVDTTAPTLTPPGNIVVGATGTNGAVVSFSVGASDNLDPAPALVVNPPSGSIFPIGVTTVNLSLTDASSNTSLGNFTVTVQNQTNAPNFINAGTVPLTANGFTATGFSVGVVTLGFDPAPGQVLTLVNNTSANPIDGAFTDLADGGTVLTSHGGRSLLFQSNYSGGDGNDITLTLLNPEIVVEEPLLTGITDGDTKSLGTTVLGSPVSVVFTIKNTGPGILNGLTITKNGPSEGDFIVTESPAAPVVGPTGTTTFTLQFNPSTSGAKTASIQIQNDDGDENPFDINLAGQALSASDDTDTDGLNDAAEFLMSPLGFDWQVTQISLVQTLMINANVAGLYTQGQYTANYNTGFDAGRSAGQAEVTSSPNAYDLYTLSQIHGLHLPTPLLDIDPATGEFTLTISVEKSTTLQAGSFALFPMSAPQVEFSADGRLKFTFTVPENAAFFRVTAGSSAAPPNP